MTKMIKDNSYQPPPNTFCSFVETYFCVPNAICKGISNACELFSAILSATDYNCPENCEEISYEIDVAYNQIDGKETYTRVRQRAIATPSPSFDPNSVDLKRFLNAPGKAEIQMMFLN